MDPKPNPNLIPPPNPKYPIERKLFISLITEFIAKMCNIPAFIDSALVENLFIREHKTAIKAIPDESDKIRKIHDFVLKKLPVKSDIFVKALLQSYNDYLVGKLLPEITNITEVRRYFNLYVKQSAIKFEGKYQIENFISFRVYFTKYMSDMPTFTDLALTVNLLNFEDKGRICLKANPTNQIREMCDIVEKKLPSKSDEFLYCLRESGNDYLVYLLQPDFIASSDYPRKETGSGVSIKPRTYANSYSMNKRGRVLIINNVEFDDRKLDKRDGSEKDKDDLYSYFSDLKFEVIVESNLTAKKMEEVLEEEIKSEKGLEEDCFILFILSHGRVSEIYGVDGKTMPYSVIYEKFNNSPMWNGSEGNKEKPKLIYIQACQPFMKEEKVESPIYPGGHTYIMYATIPGDDSMRHPEKGSRLIQSLIKVYKENDSDKDVESMGIMVRELVYKSKYGKYLQIAVCRTSLPKRVYLR